MALSDVERGSELGGANGNDWGSATGDVGTELCGVELDDSATDPLIRVSDGDGSHVRTAATAHGRSRCFWPLPRTRGWAVVTIGCVCVAVVGLLYTMGQSGITRARVGSVSKLQEYPCEGAVASPCAGAVASPCEGAVASPCEGAVSSPYAYAASPCDAAVASPCDAAVASPCGGYVEQVSPCAAEPATTIVTVVIYPTTTTTVLATTTTTMTTTTQCCPSCRHKGGTVEYCRDVCKVTTQFGDLNDECGTTTMTTTTTTMCCPACLARGNGVDVCRNMCHGSVSESDLNLQCGTTTTTTTTTECCPACLARGYGVNFCRHTCSGSVSEYELNLQCGMTTTTTMCCPACRQSGGSVNYCRQVCSIQGASSYELDEQCGTTTTTTPPLKIGYCEIYGDPHITTFDHWHTTNYVEGEYWLVKSDMVKIQVKYEGIPGTQQLSVMKALAIGGEFMTDSKGDEHRIVVQPEAAYYDSDTMLDSSAHKYFQEVQLKHGTAFGKWDSKGIKLQRGIPKEETMSVVHLLLPLGVNLTINQWSLKGGNRWLNVHLEMPPVPGGQDGQCGNFNGDISDEKRTQIQMRDAWQVPKDDKQRLFVGPYQERGFRGKFRDIASALSEACKEAIEEQCAKEFPDTSNHGEYVMSSHHEQDWNRNDCQHKYTFDEWLPNTPCPTSKPALASVDGWSPHVMHIK